MGTRSLIHFKDDGETICTVYRQFDGYPEGRGKELADWLTEVTLVNGLSLEQPVPKANGVGCLAAQWIAYEKDGPGGVYMTKAGRSMDWEEYAYEVDVDPVTLSVVLRCFDQTSKLFEGLPSEYAAFLKTLDGE